MGDFELFAELGMGGPFPLEVQNLAGSGRHQAADGAYQIFPAVDLELDNAVAVFLRWYR